MADTTKANVLLIAPELSTVSDDLFTLVLADAALEFTDDEFVDADSNDREEIIQRYWVAHNLTLLNRSSLGSGAIKKEKVHHVEIEYSTVFNDSELLSTRYGAIFKKYYYKYRQLRVI